MGGCRRRLCPREGDDDQRDKIDRSPDIELTGVIALADRILTRMEDGKDAAVVAQREERQHNAREKQSGCRLHGPLIGASGVTRYSRKWGRCNPP